MTKYLLAAAAAAATVAIAPALAQTSPAQPPKAHHGAAKEITRAEMVQKVQQHFARVDANNDGFVTSEEIAAARQAMRAKVQHRMARGAGGMFERLDTNNDGVITRAEFDSVMAKRAGKRGKGHRGMGHFFGMADLGNDGRISLQEAIAAATQFFDSADTNRDGVLTRDEIRAARKAMRSKPAG